MGPPGAVGQTACFVCQTPIDPEDRFCRHCGMRAQRGATGSIPPPASVAQPPAEGGTGSHADPLIGATVAERYRIVSLLGRGGMGVVYKVEHAKIGKSMALKLLTGELSRNPETVQRFKREALMASRLSHPNTVQVFDYGSSGGLTYLAMEFLSGQDLGQLTLRHGPLPFARLGPLVQQICGSLAEAHGQGIVHRDLKPENVFVTRTPSGQESIKVLDFGLAKLRESRDLNEITSSGFIVGTPYYMPPEQVRGDDVDHRGDVYALGALLYTCLTGTHAFEAPTPIAVLTLQLTKIPEPPHLKFPELNISPGVSAILGKALEKDPNDRFQSVLEFERAVGAELLRTSQTQLHVAGSGYFQRPADDDDAATRDEVAQYERSLRRRTKFGRGFLIGALLVGTFVAGRVLWQESRAPSFDGREREPNEEVGHALLVPWGREVRGHLGRRVSADVGDRDLYRFEVPQVSLGERVGGVTLTRFELSALPNMAICGWIFRSGSENPLYRFCTGRPGAALDLPRLAMTPGSYLVAVHQDTEIYDEGVVPYVLENVSDDYVLRWQTVSPNAVTSPPSAPGVHDETEPNQERDVTTLAVGEEMRGRLSTMRDEDVVCATASTGEARFVVEDAPDGARPSRAVLQVTPLGGPTDRIPVRVHSAQSSIEVSERDEKSPFLLPAGDLAERPCVQLELVPNPWAPTPHPLVAPAGEQEWIVRLEAITK